MSVINNKLVPVDYDSNGTTDLAFLRPVFPTSLSGTLQGVLSVWLLGPTATSSLVQAQSPVGGIFTYANGNRSVLGDGFIPGFGGPVNAFFSSPAPLFGDFNNDGKTDQIFGSLVYDDELDDTTFRGYELAVWSMNGTAVTDQTRLLTPDGALPIVAAEWANPSLYNIGGQGPLGDFNGDGFTDILFVRPNTSNDSVDIAFWMIQNNTVVAQEQVGNSGAGWSLVNTNDFDGNGSTDLLFTRANVNGTTSVGVWLQNGLQSTARDNVGTAQPGWAVVDTNDFDGDGKADILFARAADNGGIDVAVWTMDGTQVTGQDIVGNATAGWAIVDHNDFNNDGKADLLFSRDVGGGQQQYAVWLLDGIGAPLAQQSLITTDLTLSLSGDVNGDGIADLVFYDEATNEVSVALLGSSGFVSQTVSLGIFDDPTNPVGWQPPFIQGDFDRPPFPQMMA